MKTKKKGLHLKKENFVPQILVETGAQMHTKVKLLGDAGADYTQIIGGDTVKLGGYISPPPWVSPPLSVRR